MQLKCTATAANIEQETFPFDLLVKNYNDLRAESIVPRLLVVVCVPEEITAWIKQTEQELCMRRCGYWYSLADMPDTKNNQIVRIHIPRGNIFSVEFLQEAMRRIAAGEWL